VKDGGVDVNPGGIAILAGELGSEYVSLALACSAGKLGVLYSHYVWRYPQEHIDRVTADGGTTSSAGHVGTVVSRFRNLLEECSLIVPCVSGKASVLYAIDARGVSDAVLAEVHVEAFGAEADFYVDGVPDIVAKRSLGGTEITLNTFNMEAPEVRYYKATGVLGNFSVLVDVPPPSNYDHEDTSVDEFTDYKYKASFVATGTRNGGSRTVEGQRSSARYVIADDSTL
jgi:hypothetical protein